MEPTSKDDMRANVRRSDLTTVVRTVGRERGRGRVYESFKEEDERGRSKAAHKRERVSALIC